MLDRRGGRRSAKKGFLESGMWTKAFVQANYPQVMSADGHIDGKRLLALPQDRPDHAWAA